VQGMSQQASKGTKLSPNSTNDSAFTPTSQVHVSIVRNMGFLAGNVKRSGVLFKR